MTLQSPRRFGETLCHALGLDANTVAALDLHVDLDNVPTVTVKHLAGWVDGEMRHELASYTVVRDTETRKTRRLKPAANREQVRARSVIALQGVTIEVSPRGA